MICTCFVKKTGWAILHQCVKTVKDDERSVSERIFSTVFVFFCALPLFIYVSKIIEATLIFMGFILDFACLVSSTYGKSHVLYDDD